MQSSRELAILIVQQSSRAHVRLRDHIWHLIWLQSRRGLSRSGWRVSTRYTRSSRARIHALCVTRYTHLDTHIIVRTHIHLDTCTCDNQNFGWNIVEFTAMRKLLYNIIVPTLFDRKSRSSVPVFFVAHSGLFSITSLIDSQLYPSIENITEYY